MRRRPSRENPPPGGVQIDRGWRRAIVDNLPTGPGRRQGRRGRRRRCSSTSNSVYGRMFSMEAASGDDDAVEDHMDQASRCVRIRRTSASGLTRSTRRSQHYSSLGPGQRVAETARAGERSTCRTEIASATGRPASTAGTGPGHCRRRPDRPDRKSISGLPASAIVLRAASAGLAARSRIQSGTDGSCRPERSNSVSVGTRMIPRRAISSKQGRITIRQLAVLDRVDAGIDSSRIFLEALGMGRDRRDQAVRLGDDRRELVRRQLRRLNVLVRNGERPGDHRLDEIGAIPDLLADGGPHLVGTLASRYMPGKSRAPGDVAATI